jgi:hypothetical protein
MVSSHVGSASESPTFETFDSWSVLETNITSTLCLRLPLELLLFAFGLAATTSRETCLSLCLVSSWTHHIFHPELLRTIVLSSDFQCRHFYPRITTTQHNSLLDRFQHIRNLWVDSDVLHAPHYPALISHNFPGLRNISVSFALFTAMALEACIAPPDGLSLVLVGGVRELRTSLREIAASPRPSPLLFAAARLQLTTIAIGPSNPLAHFPFLTHLAMPYFGVLGIDAPLDRLTMLVFVVHTSSSQNVHWDCRQRVLRVRLEGRKRLFFVEEVDSTFKERWLGTVCDEFPSVWDRASGQTALLEEVTTSLCCSDFDSTMALPYFQIYDDAGGNWTAVQEAWKERFTVYAPHISRIHVFIERIAMLTSHAGHEQPYSSLKYIL